MAVIRDTMPAFELFQPTSIDDTLARLDEYKEQAWVLAGGLDSFDWLKDRVKRPAVVVDIGGVDELRGIRATADGLEIGAGTTLTEVATHPDVIEQYGLLAEAAGFVASPQIRNQGTLGGNVSQDTRCWYYRDGWTCYRAGGNICYADTPTAMNREHAILEADRCVAINPSDTGGALVALDAEMVIRNRGGERVVAAEDFFVGPNIDITRMTALMPGDLLTAIRIPSTWAGVRFYFEKVRDRQVWDFALVSVASAMKLSGETIDEARVVVNGVAARPLRIRRVEDGLRGQTIGDDMARLAGEAAILEARPLTHNTYKVPLMRNLVARSIRGAEA